ncbi:MAG: cobalamin-binding protein [Actinomycetota bacterium]|nr:cobalamin-binding protein [Actinomycetota bacterium]
MAANLLGCAALKKEPSKEGASPAVSMTDDLSRQVSLSGEVKRIISLAPSNTEILFSLGLGDKVIAVTDFCDYPKEALGKDKIGGFSEPNVEKIIELEPDLILATGMHEKYIEQFDELGLTTFVLDPKRISDILAAIERVGKLTAKEERAKELVSGMREKLAEIDEKLSSLKDEERPLTYYEIWNDPIMTVGSNSLIGEAVTKAGAKSIGDGLAGEYPKISLEVLVEKDPKIIIAPKGSMGDPKSISERKGWENISAVKEGRVFVVDEDVLVRFGPRIVDGIYEMAKLIHPDRF